MLYEKLKRHCNDIMAWHRDAWQHHDNSIMILRYVLHTYDIMAWQWHDITYPISWHDNGMTSHTRYHGMTSHILAISWQYHNDTYHGATDPWSTRQNRIPKDTGYHMQQNNIHTKSSTKGWIQNEFPSENWLEDELIVVIMWRLVRYRRATSSEQNNQYWCIKLCGATTASLLLPLFRIP